MCCVQQPQLQMADTKPGGILGPEPFLGYGTTKPLTVSASDGASAKGQNGVRNEVEHFIPKSPGGPGMAQFRIFFCLNFIAKSLCSPYGLGKWPHSCNVGKNPDCGVISSLCHPGQETASLNLSLF